MTKQSSQWNTYQGKDIPSSSELFPIFYKYVNSNSDILDIGCGFGKTIFQLYSEGYKNSFGLDVSKPGIDFANQKIAQENLHELENHFQVGDAMALPYSDEKFDCVITQAFWTSILSNERLEILKEIKRVLKPNGIFYAALWTQSWDLDKYKQRYLEGEKKGYETGSFDVKDPETSEVKYIAHHYTEKEIKDLFGQRNFSFVEYMHEKAPTQHGNLINCDVIIARKIVK